MLGREWGMDPFVRGMVAVRLLSALAELAGAAAMVRLNRVEGALRINGLLGLVGPLVLAATTAIGLAGMAGHASPWRLLLVALGALLILAGTR